MPLSCSYFSKCIIQLYIYKKPTVKHNVSNFVENIRGYSNESFEKKCFKWGVYKFRHGLK